MSNLPSNKMNYAFFIACVLFVNNPFRVKKGEGLIEITYTTPHAKCPNSIDLQRIETLEYRSNISPITPTSHQSPQQRPNITSIQFCFG